MAVHLTLNTVVHAAFRRTLARFDHALETFPAGSQPRADQLMRAWTFFDEELHRHHHYEEQFFWPALEQTDADLRRDGSARVGSDSGGCHWRSARSRPPQHRAPRASRP